jgi:hypothetical protein
VTRGITCSTSLPKARATADDVETVEEAVSDTVRLGAVSVGGSWCEPPRKERVPVTRVR